MSDLKCISCEAPISPAFKAALRDNICPGCGDSIFTEEAQELMEDLRNAMEEMPNDPQGLAGWLMSNYKMIKVGDGEPTGFYGSPREEEAPNRLQEGEMANLKVAPNRLQQFLSNAGVKPKDMAALASKVKEASYDMEVGEEDYDDDVPDESNYPEFTKAALASMNEGKANVRVPQKSIENNIGNEELHPALQEDRLVRLSKQRELINGGSVGKISRST